MKFQNKILLSIWGVVLSLLVITFFIINYWTRSGIEETFSKELRSSHANLRVLMALQSEILLRGSQVIAESPRLRAVVELQDAKTAYQLSQEINQTTAGDLFLLTDFRGRPLVQMLYGQKEEWDVSRFESIRQAMMRSPSTDVWSLKDKIFRVASVAIAVDKDLIGTLTIGFNIKEGEVRSLKDQTNSEILLMQQGSAILSTFGKAEQERVLAALTTSNILEDLASQDTVGTAFRVAAGNELYLGTAVRLNRVTEGSEAQILYLIIKPVEQELSRALKPILGAFGIVSLIFLVLTSIIGHLISLGITKPINALVQGTTEVSKGNYDYAIAVEGRDELSFLAQKFADMSKSLKEKINELDRLNKDLVERNVDLDETLKKLKDAQEELVQSERLAATGKITAQLAHEINNPIHNIQSCLKTSLSRLPEEMQGRELVEVAYDEITRMSKLTRQLLDFYRTSLVTDEMEPVRLNEVLREVLTSFQDELRNSGITPDTKLDPEPSEINGSKDKLKQVFINIILNAKDAMPQGGTLRIVSLAENGFAKVSVSDSGVGIPRENLGKIFDAFFTTKGKVSGVGLGLSVSYGIINQHNGTISVKSTVGEGSTFTISLPLIQETIHNDSIRVTNRE